jgi:hypothetical protein
MTKVGLIIFRGNRTGFYPPLETERLIANGRAPCHDSSRGYRSP